MPSLAVLATWLLITIWAIALGSATVPLTRKHLGLTASIRVALWIGLSLMILALAVTNLFVPLGALTAVVIMGVLTVLALGIGAAAAVTMGRATSLPRRQRLTTSTFSWWALPLAFALVLALLATAHFTFAAANQWDTGLYHLNAIQYATEYRVIPGLANLHDRLGTTNSHHLLTAFLSNSGWGIDAFRLSVGFFAFMFSIDLFLRLFAPRTAKGSTQFDRGTLVLLVSSIGLWGFLLSNPEEIITSASPDMVALFLSLVAGAYWVDALTTRRREWASTALVVAALAGTVRPHLWVFTVIAALVFVIAMRRRPLHRGTRSTTLLTWGSVAISAFLLVTSQVRDVVQSGWVLFPLDRLPLPVDWRAYNPAASREWIVSWARQPGASPGDVNDNWTWLPDWIVRTAADWSVNLLIGLVALSITTALFLVGRLGRVALPSWRLLVAALLPVAGVIVVWFFTAPDPRFAWGALLLAGAIPAALVLGAKHLRHNGPITLMLATGFVAVLVLPVSVSALLSIDGELGESQQVVEFNLGPWTIAPALVPVTTPELQPYSLPTGETLLTPTSDDRCWLAFPSCSPYHNDSLLFRGDDVQDGFASSLARDEIAP